jgi:hypothetical protein
VDKVGSDASRGITADRTGCGEGRVRRCGVTATACPRDRSGAERRDGDSAAAHVVQPLVGCSSGRGHRRRGSGGLRSTRRAARPGRPDKADEGVAVGAGQVASPRRGISPSGGATEARRPPTPAGHSCSGLWLVIRVEPRISSRSSRPLVLGTPACRRGRPRPDDERRQPTSRGAVTARVLRRPAG